MCKGLAALPATCLKSAWCWLQKPDLHPDQSTINKKKTKKEAKPKRTDQAEVRRSGESLGNLMNSEAGLAAFTSFLKSEFSQENMQFWEACEDYQKMTSRKKLATKAREIYQEYIDKESPKQVNLDAATRAAIWRNLADISTSCFEEAQRKTFLLMEKDSYWRFLKSQLFLDLLQETGSGKGHGVEGMSGGVLPSRLKPAPQTC